MHYKVRVKYHTRNIRQTWKPWDFTDFSRLASQIRAYSPPHTSVSRSELIASWQYRFPTCSGTIRVTRSGLLVCKNVPSWCAKSAVNRHLSLRAACRQDVQWEIATPAGFLAVLVTIIKNHVCSNSLKISFIFFYQTKTNSVFSTKILYKNTRTENIWELIWRGNG